MVSSVICSRQCFRKGAWLENYCNKFVGPNLSLGCSGCSGSERNVSASGVVVGTQKIGIDMELNRVVNFMI